MDEAPTSDIDGEDVIALIDSLDAMIATAPSSLLRSHVRLNRKRTKALVDAIGARLDVRSASLASREGPDPAGMSKSQAADTLVTEAFKNLDFVTDGGGGGAIYRIRYLDVSRKRISEAIGLLRKTVEMKAAHPPRSDQT